MDLNLTTKQLVSLSPRMLQSMEILNMTALELSAYLENLALENPVVDLEEPERKETVAKWRHMLDWLESADRKIPQASREAESREQFTSLYGAADPFEDNLYLSLLSQLHSLRLPPRLRSVAAYVIESLDSNGYLDDSDEAIASALHIPLPEAEEARLVVQSLEPAGVGARSLRECLMLQLRRLPGDCSLALAITENHLDALGRNRIGQIAKKIGKTPEEVREAAKLIRSLHPRPGMDVSAREAPAYMIPDLIVQFSDLKPEVIPNDSSFPTIKISSFYRTLIKSTEDDEVKFYLRNKIRQAAWVIQSIERRKSTLIRCAECILEIQSEFFRKGHGHLVPMTLDDVASRLNLHASTVSRAIRGKHIQCSFGTFPMTSFFSRGLGDRNDKTKNASPDHAKDILKRLIQTEDREHPCSDQKLSELMAKEGVTLSRRTVAKYRDELGYPNAYSRRAE